MMVTSSDSVSRGGFDFRSTLYKLLLDGWEFMNSYCPSYIVNRQRFTPSNPEFDDIEAKKLGKFMAAVSLAITYVTHVMRTNCSCCMRTDNPFDRVSQFGHLPFRRRKGLALKKTHN